MQATVAGHVRPTKVASGMQIFPRDGETYALQPIAQSDTPAASNCANAPCVANVQMDNSGPHRAGVRAIYIRRAETEVEEVAE